MSYAVLADMDPLRATDELRDLAAGPCQCLGDLNAAGAAADHTPVLALIGHAVIPVGGVKRRSRKTLAPRNIRVERLVQKTGGADKHIRDIRATFGGLDLPTAVGEPCPRDLLVEADE